MSKVITRNNTKGQVELLWGIVFAYEEGLVDGEAKDKRMDEIKTVMGWIEEDLNVTETYNI